MAIQNSYNFFCETVSFARHQSILILAYAIQIQGIRINSYLSLFLRLYLKRGIERGQRKTKGATVSSSAPFPPPAHVKIVRQIPYLEASPSPPLGASYCLHTQKYAISADGPTLVGLCQRTAVGKERRRGTARTISSSSSPLLLLSSRMLSNQCGEPLRPPEEEGKEGKSIRTRSRVDMQESDGKKKTGGGEKELEISRHFRLTGGVFQSVADTNLAPFFRPKHYLFRSCILYKGTRKKGDQLTRN